MCIFSLLLSFLPDAVTERNENMFDKSLRVFAYCVILYA